MKQIILNVPENKYSFFMELVKSLGFIIEVNNEESSHSKVLKDIKDAVDEVNLIKAGKLKGISAKALINEL